MTKLEYLNMIREGGKRDAEALRNMAASGMLTDTQIIDQEYAIPQWSAEKDYSICPIGTPVVHEGQVYGLAIPHSPATRPSAASIFWSIKHTKNKDKAKAYVSGVYMQGEYCVYGDKIWKSLIDNNSYSPEEYPANWELVE